MFPGYCYVNMHNCHGASIIVRNPASFANDTVEQPWNRGKIEFTVVIRIQCSVYEICKLLRSFPCCTCVLLIWAFMVINSIDSVHITIESWIPQENGTHLLILLFFTFQHLQILPNLTQAFIRFFSD